jgi:lipopolysaccharide/colanic/teichoic acid biosynthesis glycosyltransferase
VDIVKRLLDLFGALIGLIILSPLMSLLGILIKFDSPGPILYKQLRVGRGELPFNIVKYRTMHEAEEDILDHQLVGDPSLKLSWEKYQKIIDDPRVTRVGRILRRTSLDELPQLWNVLRGEMSLVGPRPILPEQVELYGENFTTYSQVRPGMTGLWQVSGRNMLSLLERAEWDREYIQTWSLLLDFQILVRTVWAVVRGDGAY